VRALALAVLAVAACKGKPPEQNKPPPKPPALGSGTDPWAGVDAAPETAQTKQARVDAALARVKDIVPKLAKLRHLELLHAIPAEFQTKDDFRAFVHREIEKEAAHTKDTQSAMVQLGLLPAGIDLSKAEEQAFATQAAAYYDPAQKKFFIVMVPDAPAMLDITSAHELTHGLTDQHFDLKTYMAENANGHSTLDDDAQSARRFVVEGDATFAMFIYAMSDMAGSSDVSPQLMKMLRGQIESMGDVDAMLDMMSSQTGVGSGSGDIAESMRAMHDIPRAILVPMIDSYMKGAIVAIDAYEQGGWAGVDALYKNPPESTEQVLHPKEKLLGANRDHPHKVTVAKLAGYDEVTSNVLGELEWQVYFGLWKHTGGDKVSENWGGDRYSFQRRKGTQGGGKVVALVATDWDSEADAKRFADAYASTVAARLAAPGHSGKIAVRTAGARVFIVDGDDDPAVMDALVAGAKIDP
jgi:hypothetical protein